MRQELPKSVSLDNPGEGLHGSWRSEKGRCTIGKDPVTARLSYLEPLGEEKVHGWLEPIKDEEAQWHGTLVFLKEP